MGTLALFSATLIMLFAWAYPRQQLKMQEVRRSHQKNNRSNSN